MKNSEFHNLWEISATCTGTGAVQPSRTEPVPVQVGAVPVQVVLCFLVLTSVRFLAINCLFLIRFE